MDCRPDMANTATAYMPVIVPSTSTDASSRPSPVESRPGHRMPSSPPRPPRSDPAPRRPGWAPAWTSERRSAGLRGSSSVCRRRLLRPGQRSRTAGGGTGYGGSHGNSLVEDRRPAAAGGPVPFGGSRLSRRRSVRRGPGCVAWDGRWARKGATRRRWLPISACVSPMTGCRPPGATSHYRRSGPIRSGFGWCPARGMAATRSHHHPGDCRVSDILPRVTMVRSGRRSVSGRAGRAAPGRTSAGASSAMKWPQVTVRCSQVGRPGPPQRRRVEAERGAPVLLEHGDRHPQPVAGVPVGLVVVDVDAGRGAVVGDDRGDRRRGRRPGRRRGRRRGSPAGRWSRGRGSGRRRRPGWRRSSARAGRAAGPSGRGGSRRRRWCRASRPTCPGSAARRARPGG